MSMHGQPWTHLIECVRNFFRQLEIEPIKDNVKVSVITYGTFASTVIYQQTPSEHLVDKIVFDNYWLTFFSSPL